MDFSLPIIVSAPPQISGDPLARLVMRLSAFERLGQEEISALRSIVTVDVVEAHENLHKTAGPYVTVLLSGLACHYKMLSGNRRQILGLIVPGDISHYGFLTGDAAPAQITSLAISQVGRISIADFTELCQRYPRIMRAIIRGMATAAAISKERLVTLGQRTSVERMSHLMCEMNYRLDVVGLVGPGNTFEFHITQAELADTLGLSTVHVNRTLQVLRRDGLIAMRQGKVSVDNLPGLIGAARFDPYYLLQSTMITPPTVG